MGRRTRRLSFMHLERSTTLKLTFTKSIGMILLAIFLIAWGIIMLLGINGLGVLLAILAIAAGIFILLGR